MRDGTCPPAPSGFAPRRVIRIDTNDDKLSIRLYEPKLHEEIQWCCLSYCWGAPGQNMMTTKATLEESRSGIDLAALPKTLYDSVIVASRLGMQYIWIDAICIVQDDDDEKMLDIAQMAEIYSHAYFTISAGRASAATEGFLHNIDLTQPKGSISLRYLSSSGEEGKLIVADEPTGRELPDPINSRAWTFQERVLAPRLVEFSQTQVRWRCKTCLKCESGAPPQTAWRRYFESPSIVDTNTMAHLDAAKSFNEWHDLVSYYSKRNLSYPADKLIAFSAVAKTVARPGRYLAGLWETDFPNNLMWKVFHIWTPILGDQDLRTFRPLEYRAPSWSWASVDGHVTIDSLATEGNAPQIACEVLDCQVELANRALPYGPVSSGYITIKGRVRPGIFWPLTGQMHFRDPGVGETEQVEPTPGYKGFADTKDFEREPSTSEDGPSFMVWCLHIRNDGGRGEGLLLVHEPEQGAFKRTGHFYWTISEVGTEFKFSEEGIVKII